MYRANYHLSTLKQEAENSGAFEKLHSVEQSYLSAVPSSHNPSPFESSLDLDMVHAHINHRIPSSQLADELPRGTVESSEPISNINLVQNQQGPEV